MCHGAVRYSQSQGSVERFNRTLLTLICKVLDAEDDWQSALGLMLYHYRVRPHSVTKISPFEAMMGWAPGGLLTEPAAGDHAMSLSAWVDQLSLRSARVRDYVEELLSGMTSLKQKARPTHMLSAHMSCCEGLRGTRSHRPHTRKGGKSKPSCHHQWW